MWAIPRPSGDLLLEQSWINLLPNVLAVPRMAEAVAELQLAGYRPRATALVLQ